MRMLKKVLVRAKDLYHKMSMEEWRQLLLGSETLPLFERGWGSRWSPVSGGSNIPSGTGHKAFVTCSRTHSCSYWGGVPYLTTSCMSQSLHLTFLANENE